MYNNTTQMNFDCILTIQTKEFEIEEWIEYCLANDTKTKRNWIELQKINKKNILDCLNDFFDLTFLWVILNVLLEDDLMSVF